MRWVPNIVSKRELGLFIPMIATVGVWVEESPSFLAQALQNDVNTTFSFSILLFLETNMHT